MNAEQAHPQAGTDVRAGGDVRAEPQGRRVTILGGGVGGAKLSHGFALAAGWPDGPGRGVDLSVVVNTGDDLELHGLAVSPDLDTVMYTLAGLANEEAGWGLAGETWSAMEMLARYGAETWFRLGDRDLATHLRRSQGLREGRRLTEVTAELAARLGVPARLLPMTDASVRTEIRTAEGWLEFQDYFVRRGHQDRVLEIRHRGIEAARPTAEVLRAVASADLIVFAPSNPFVSIGTIMALPGMVESLHAATAPIVAVSPVVAGQALRGPADRMLESLGGTASATGVVEHYRSRYPGLVDVFVLDRADAGEAEALRESGIHVVVLETVMRDHGDRRRLAEGILEAYLPG